MNTENNKIIAEFMGWELKHNPNISQKTWSNKEKGYCKDKESTFIEYSNDWNYLFEVLNKLTTLNEFQDYEFKSLFWDTFCQLDIKEVYIQVVLFIKWYNEYNLEYTW